MSAILLAVLWLFASSGGTQARQPVPPSMHISVDNTTITSGDALKLHVTFTNSSDAVTSVPRPFDQHLLGVYSVEVADQEGRRAPPTAYGKVRQFAPGNGSSILKDLKPGESYSAEIAVTSLVDLTMPGQYTVQATCRRSQGNLSSNKLVITVAAP